MIHHHQVRLALDLQVTQLRIDPQRAKKAEMRYRFKNPAAAAQTGVQYLGAVTGGFQQGGL